MAGNVLKVAGLSLVRGLKQHSATERAQSMLGGAVVGPDETGFRAQSGRRS